MYVDRLVGIEISAGVKKDEKYTVNISVVTIMHVLHAHPGKPVRFITLYKDIGIGGMHIATLKYYRITS